MVLVQDDNDFFTTLFLGLVLLGGFPDDITTRSSSQSSIKTIYFRCYKGIQIGKWMIENNKEENI